MKITDVKATRISLGPRPQPVSDATYTESAYTFSMVEVFTDEGITGLCPVVRSRELTEGPLKTMLLGESPLNIERLWNKMYSGWCHPAAAGDAMRAMSHIDIALWDIIGKPSGNPYAACSEVIGAGCRRMQPVATMRRARRSKICRRRWQDT